MMSVAIGTKRMEIEELIRDAVVRRSLEEVLKFPQYVRDEVILQ